jgi:hypothetical protein
MLDLHNTDLTQMAGVEKVRREKIANMIRSEQLLQELKPRKPGLRDHILAVVGSAMISIGEWMQERSVLVLSHSAGTNQPDC